jgi:hypothetical protein
MTEKLREKAVAKGFDYKKIKSFDDACRACSTTEEEFNARFQNLGLESDTINYEKLKIITKAINNGWTPDWDNTRQLKWRPWFRLSSGFGFHGSAYGYVTSDADSGSRLCFESEAKSDYAAQQFLDIYTEFIK